jgi:hypothetical protein
MMKRLPRLTIVTAFGIAAVGCSSADPTAGEESTSALAATPATYCGGHIPNPSVTPGRLCTPQDPNFDGNVYPEHIAHCARNVSMSEKDAVAAAYGIPRSDYPMYKFDHYIPLELGGDDDITNVWPQLSAEATVKDALENDLGAKLRAGRITQAEAVAQMRAWRPAGLDPSCEHGSPSADAGAAVATTDGSISSIP